MNRLLLLVVPVSLVFLLVAATPVVAVEEIVNVDGSLSSDEECEDLNEHCKGWAQLGECIKNSAYMNLNCRSSCGLCGCVDIDERCPHWAYKNPFCVENQEYMYMNCPRSCKACNVQGEALKELQAHRVRLSKVGGDERLLETKYGYKQSLAADLQEETKTAIQEMETYMEEKVYINDYYKDIRDKCFNRHEHCAYFVATGACESNRVWMRQNCAPMCQMCQELDFKFWCPIDDSKPMAVPNPGDLDRLFQRILTEEAFQKYEPKVLSMPNPTSGDIANGPWFIVFESFLNETEANTLIELGSNVGYQLSYDTGVERVDGTFEQKVSNWRTSATAWCDKDCLVHPVSQAIADRVEDVTGIPQVNSEHMQILKYLPGEYYKVHHDCTPFMRERQMGPRVLTMFLYLSDVEQGGGTNFPDLGITVTPKRGRAVLWPNVLNEDPLSMDARTAHQALPVEKGVKYGANYWIHQRDWREVHARRCI